MTKKQFLAELNRLLQNLPESDRNDILYDYEDHIQAAMDDGKTEEEAVYDLGSPQSIAEEIVGANPVDEEQDQPLQSTLVPNSSVGRGMVAFISLLFFNLVFIVGPVIGILGAFIGLYAAALSCLISPFALIVDLFTQETPLLLAFFFVLATFSFGYLFLLATNYLAKNFYKVLLMYWKFNVKIVTGGN